MQQHNSLSRWLWQLHSWMPKVLWANCNPQRGESISINLLTNVQSRLATQATASVPAVLAAHPNMTIAIIEPVTDLIKMNYYSFMQWIVLLSLCSILIAVSLSTSSMHKIPDSWLFFSMQWSLWCDCWRIDCLHRCHHCSHVVVAVLIYISSCTFAVDCCVNLTSRCCQGWVL